MLQLAAAEIAREALLKAPLLRRVEEGQNVGVLIAHQVAGCLAVWVAKEMPQLMRQHRVKGDARENQIVRRGVAGRVPVHAAAEARGLQACSQDDRPVRQAFGCPRRRVRMWAR